MQLSMVKVQLMMQFVLYYLSINFVFIRAFVSFYKNVNQDDPL